MIYELQSYKWEQQKTTTHQCSRTLLKSFENSSIEEISDKEVDELRRSGVVMETTEMITTPPMYGDFFLPNDYEKPTNFEKPRTIKRNWERPYKYHR